MVGKDLTWRFFTDAPVDVSRYQGCSSPLKFCVLELIDRKGEITYLDLVRTLDMPKEVASDRIRNYVTSGLVSGERRQTDRRTRYTLTPSGENRLNWFRSQHTP